jgi:hypothetical protein
LALVLTVLVIAAAGVAGTAHFTGPRWYPHIGSGHQPSVGTTPLLRVVPRMGRAPLARPRATSTTWLLAVVTVVALLVVANLIWRWIRGHWRAPQVVGLRVAATDVLHVAPPEAEVEPARLLTGIELALQALAEEREPADAVVRAWLGLQETAEESGIVRRPSETPTEFAGRVLSGAFPNPEPLQTLLRLYLRTRFGDHPVTGDDVSAVREALERLLASWHAAAGSTASPAR